MQAMTMGFNSEYHETVPSFDEVGCLAGSVLIEFGAPWCGHCQAASPAIKAVLSQCTEQAHIRVLDGKGKRLGRQFGVKLWPTLILLQDGKEVGRVVRCTTEQAVRDLMALRP
ncbi:thioredoxin family protein [Marinomonas sp. IMCC 4694]|uniref:thioredoxin family protein n=1 Tax=Marinomonas sp. IMCC 4694 TaxID=2605432 RepID=UPI0011E7ABD7|nr:thioredoxin family protein [Marinomonas sp. IMCC 4694]TYL47353.1 thioredoxin family protein [Marinomonas sp. IMCC 4694]